MRGVIPVAVYLRVSSKDGRQDEANQEPACAQLCAGRNWTPVWFRERESGARERPEWRRLLDSARRGEVRAVVFWALDRVGRSRVQVAHDLSELARWGVQLASVQDAWIDQPPGPLRDLLLQIMAWVAEGERARLIERTKAGQQRARLQGRVPGRPRAKADAVAAALAAVRNGAKVNAAARAHGLPASTLRNYIDARRAQNGSVQRPGAPTKIRGL